MSNTVVCSSAMIDLGSALLIGLPGLDNFKF